MDNNESKSFARKYRPKNLSEYLGDGVKNIVKSRFSDKKNFPQVILMHGTHGTGKTSMARLMAKEYHCLSRVDGHACGKCEMCLELDERLIDAEAGVSVEGVQEVDIGTDSGKSNINQILDEAMLTPLPPFEYKILILDEFHMATKQAQNRLLKIFEEPPKHLVFIMCTTNPENIIDTILSRCQLKIEVRKPSVDELADRLEFVCKQEGIKTSKEALKHIARKSNRIPRDAMMLLESVAKNYGYKATLENVMKQTNEVGSEIYMEYFDAANDSLSSIMMFNKSLNEKGITSKQFMGGLTRFVLDCMYVKYGISLDDYSPEFLKTAKRLFDSYTSQQFDMLLQIIEYALKMIDSDDTKSELILTMTATRIGKVPMLAIGLSGQNVQAEKENKASLVAYKGLLEEDIEKSKKVSLVSAGDELMNSIMGRDVIEIKNPTSVVFEQEDTSSKNISLDVDGISQNGEDRMFTDDDLFKLFEQD